MPLVLRSFGWWGDHMYDEGPVTVGRAFDLFAADLPTRSAEVEVLVAAGRALALEIDVAQLADDNGKTKPAAAAVTALRALVDDLIAKGRAGVADPDEADDWAVPSVVDLAPVRDAKKPGASNARPRGNRGGAAAS